MKVTITFESDCEEDGFVGSTTVVREGIDSLHDLAEAYCDATVAGGFTYVENVAFEKDDGQMVFSGF
tara:strand:- start:492 stop:692 length:201 start_codon:yes stop_codon:yes gene_type:complete